MVASKNKIFWGFCIALIPLTACSQGWNIFDSNSKYRQAINEYHEKDDKPCLEITKSQRRDSYRSQFEALQNLGLVEAEEVLPKRGVGKKYTIYNLTKKAHPYVWEHTLVGNKVYSICFGDRVVKDVVKVSPWPNEPDRGVHVKYTYAIENIPSWANDQKLKEVSVVLKRELEGIDKTVMQKNLAKTGKGYKTTSGSAFPMTRTYK
ncbi:hypothetical protein MASR1M60_22520 [Rhodocyclaceae bacterium]